MKIALASFAGVDYFHCLDSTLRLESMWKSKGFQSCYLMLSSENLKELRLEEKWNYAVTDLPVFFLKSEFKEP